MQSPFLLSRAGSMQFISWLYNRAEKLGKLEFINWKQSTRLNILCFNHSLGLVISKQSANTGTILNRRIMIIGSLLFFPPLPPPCLQLKTFWILKFFVNHLACEIKWKPTSLFLQSRGIFVRLEKKTPWSESELHDRVTAACRRNDCQLLRIRGPRGQRDGSLRSYSRFSRQEPLLFYQVAPQLYSRGWVDPVPDPLHYVYGSAGNRTRASGSVSKNSDH
jgi:hypothetical protein